MGFVLSRTEVEALLPGKRESTWLTPPDGGVGEILESEGVHRTGRRRH